MKKVIKASTALMLAAFLSLVSVTASATYTPLKSIVKSFDINGTTTTVIIDPAFALSTTNNGVKVDLKSRINAADLQSTIHREFNKRWKYDECGERLETSNVSVVPMVDGRLKVGITGRAQLWECVKTKLPKVTWEIKKIGFIKTKVPVTRWEMKTMKTKLVSQSFRLEAYIKPEIRGNHVTASVDVSRAMPGGLLGKLVNVFGLHGKLKNIARGELQRQLRKNAFKLPAELKAYNVNIKDAHFVNLGGGQLGLDIKANASVSQLQIAKLINEQL